MPFSLSDMSLSERTVDRSLEQQRARYEREVETLVSASLRVMRSGGYAAATVAGVLEEAGLSTRAFYRHFHSKEELFLAVFERDSADSSQRMQKRLDALPDPSARLVGWIEEVLSLGFDRRRARRTRTFASEAAILRSLHPAEFAAIQRALYEPLLAILEAGKADGSFPHTRPEEDARSIHAVCWALVEARLSGAGPADAEAARAHALRFSLPALGASTGSESNAEG
ncbi:MAG: TetR/AcrR family transcriptional regulator [Deltaproteobacteria bacterium]|nr:TetR/AcrR family transcriptional regulator [Deltaproteobacteria bacterium]MBW2386155.1 TetR/AcrR family transcriptional regulator [Deltaproteobacteria bacterium]